MYDIGVVTPTSAEGFWSCCAFEDDREGSTMMAFMGRDGGGTAPRSCQVGPGQAGTGVGGGGVNAKQPREAETSGACGEQCCPFNCKTLSRYGPAVQAWQDGICQDRAGCGWLVAVASRTPVPQGTPTRRRRPGPAAMAPCSPSAPHRRQSLDNHECYKRPTPSLPPGSRPIPLLNPALYTDTLLQPHPMCNP